MTAPEPPEAPTPLTDAARLRWAPTESAVINHAGQGAIVFADFARTLERANAALRAGLAGMLASATPSKTEHPAMFAAWQAARALLAPPEGGK